MKCQILFSGKNKTNLINLSSAESAHSIVSIQCERSNEIKYRNYHQVQAHRFFCHHVVEYWHI